MLRKHLMFAAFVVLLISPTLFSMTVTTSPSTLPNQPVRDSSQSVSEVWGAPCQQTEDGVSTEVSGNPTTTVKNTASGANLAVYVHEPSGSGPFPAVVVVPGGEHPASEINCDSVKAFTEAGFAMIRFDRDGVGKSDGKKDYNGPYTQQGVRDVIRYALELSNVDSEKVGLISYSFGVSAAAPAVATNNPGAKFYIDLEGPYARDMLEECKMEDGKDGIIEPDLPFYYYYCTKEALDQGQGNLLKSRPIAHYERNEVFWTERVAESSILKLQIPYIRGQWRDDHATTDDEVTRATTVVNEAISAGVNAKLNNTDPSSITTLWQMSSPYIQWGRAAVWAEKILGNACSDPQYQFSSSVKTYKGIPAVTAPSATIETLDCPSGKVAYRIGVHKDKSITGISLQCWNGIEESKNTHDYDASFGDAPTDFFDVTEHTHDLSSAFISGLLTTEDSPISGLGAQYTPYSLVGTTSCEIRRATTESMGVNSSWSVDHYLSQSCGSNEMLSGIKIYWESSGTEKVVLKVRPKCRTYTGLK